MQAGGKNWSKIEKIIQNKLLELCKTRTKKSSPDLFTFCKLAWSWHRQWRWQGYHVQAQFRSPMVTNTNRTYKNWRAFWKKWALTGSSLKTSNQKNRGIQSSYEEESKRTTIPWRRKLNMNHVARKKLTEANLKKAFRIKLFGLCKTRAKKSSPDLFNFYVISAGLDIANDNGRAITCRRSFKASWLQTERTKNEGPSEKTSFNGEQFETFKPKSQKL